MNVIDLLALLLYDFSLQFLHVTESLFLHVLLCQLHFISSYHLILLVLLEKNIISC